MGDGSGPAGGGPGDEHPPVHDYLRDTTGGGVDRQRPDRGRRFLVPVAPDGLPTRRRGSGRLRPYHRCAIRRWRQDRHRHVLPALPGLAGVVQQPVTGPYRQRCTRRLCGRVGAGGTGDRRPVPSRNDRPPARRDPVGPQRPVLGTPGHPRPDPLPTGRRTVSVGGFDPQRRHPGGAGTRRGRRLRSACSNPGGADRPGDHAAGAAADIAGRATETVGSPCPQGDSGIDGCRSAGGGRRG